MSQSKRKWLRPCLIRSCPPL